MWLLTNNNQCFMLLQPFSASTWLATAVVLRPVQPTNRGAAEVPPQSPLWDRRQPRSREGAVWRTPCGSGMSSFTIIKHLLSHTFKTRCEHFYLLHLACAITRCRCSISRNKCFLINGRFSVQQRTSDMSIWLMLPVTAFSHKGKSEQPWHFLH